MTFAYATHGTVPAASVTFAHSISSTVELDSVQETAHKTYSPPTWVRAMYWLAYQSPFPYEHNEAAIQAASYRRQIAGLLTEYWFGANLVAPVLDVHRERDERIAFVTRLVHGSAPTDRRHARRFLRLLTRNFLDAGLPTWQVTPYNPRAIGNLVQANDGSYRIIDLESNLVAPLVPVSSIPSALRRGQMPAFDDIDVDRLDAYADTHERQIITAIGEHSYGELRRAITGYRASEREWRGSERRIVSKAMKFAFSLVDVPGWVRGIRKVTASSNEAATSFVDDGIGAWEDEGHIDEAQADDLRARARQPEVRSALTHLGAHMAITVPLRFPLGSIARAAWTVSMRARAEWDSIVRRRPAGSARQEHTLLVALTSLVPTAGAAAYMLSKPLRANRALAVIGIDTISRKMPFHVYDRMHLQPVMVYQSQVRPDDRPSERPAAFVAARLRAVANWAPVAVPVVLMNIGVVVVGGMIYMQQDSRWWFDEKGPMNTIDAVQLAIAGIAGVAAYTTFWRRDAKSSLADSAGIFLWGAMGAGLIFFAADDYFGFHERMGDFMSAHVSMGSTYLNTADDLITLTFGITGLTVLFLFRHELLANRASSALLVAGIAAAAVMVVVDIAGKGFVRPLEFPAQTTAVGLLMLANVARYREVTTRAPRAAVAPEPALALAA